MFSEKSFPRLQNSAFFFVIYGAVTETFPMKRELKGGIFVAVQKAVTVTETFPMKRELKAENAAP